jgi:hypothetical protein
MDDTRVWWNDAKILKRLLPPAKKLIPLPVAIELLLGVDQERGIGAIFIDLNGVIDDQVDRLERIDTFRGATEPDDRVAHGGEIDDGGNTGEVLEEHPAGAKRNLLLGLAADVPSRKRFDVGPLDECVILVAQEILEEDAQGDRKALDRRVRQLGERAQS